MSDALTIVMFTHFTDKLKRNAHLSPPETGLVEATYASLLRRVWGRHRPLPQDSVL